MYFQDSSSCLLCAGDVHEEQEITTDIGDRNIREVIVINDAFVYLIVIGQEGTSMKIVLKMMPLKKKPI